MVFVFVIDFFYSFLFKIFKMMDISAVDGNKINDNNKPIDREKVHHLYQLVTKPPLTYTAVVTVVPVRAFPVRDSNRFVMQFSSFCKKNRPLDSLVVMKFLH